MGKVAHVKRVPITLNITLETREELDRKVAEGRSQGFPVERASLAAALLGRAVGSGAGPDVEALEAVAAKLDMLLGLLRKEPAPVKADRLAGLVGSVTAVRAELLAAMGKEDDDG